MGFNFSFFGEQQHRVFNYKPRYYDKEADERRQFFGTDGISGKDGKTAGDNDGKGAAGSAGAASKDSRQPAGSAPGSTIRGSFSDGNYQKTRGLGAVTKAQKIIGAVGLILFFIVLMYFAKFYTII